ncbi:CoA transferase [Streptomyces sp. NPDC052052]|uniref:CoA transferase n=1 Tax=Streptomyces sp. NPDC052052 TaxID=3154756 RepID=UPI0034350614
MKTAGPAAADWAASGVVALTGRADGPPLVPPGHAASRARALSAFIHEATAATSVPVRVDGAALLAERAAFTGHTRRGPVSAGGACRLLPTADGWSAVSCARPDDPSLLGALVGARLPEDPWPAVAGWLREHSGAELAERAELLGVAAGPVRTPALRTPASAPGPESTRPTPVVSQPTRTGPTPPVPRSPGANPSPLVPRSVAGLLVVDFSALWAGPLCAHLLSLAGARVVKVETPARPDGARRGHPGFYRLLHAGHRSVVLDPDTAPGRRALAALVDAADIVIEASRPRALARFGLDAHAAVASGTTWVSLTAAGRGSGRIGFGDDIAAAAGLVAREWDGTPLFCGDAIADPLTGLTAAARALTAPAEGGGFLHDISMSDVVRETLDAQAPEAETPDAPARPPATARRHARGWVVESDDGRFPLASPRRREPAGDAPGMGEHTASVLRGIGAPLP